MHFFFSFLAPEDSTHTKKDPQHYSLPENILQYLQE